jgi:alkylation response protein AidB-like acyl-CoA dehydrogenase
MTIHSPHPVMLLKARIAALAPLVQACRDDMEQMRRMPRPLVEAVAEAGLFRLLAPAALGGWELSLPAFMEVVEAAAALDGSVGWLVGNGGGISRVCAYLPEAFARDWLAEPHGLIVATNGAIGEAVPVPGGYRVTGRWPFGSGIHHATLVAPACRVTEPDGQGPILMCYVAAEHAEIIDTWQTSGMRGTGSNDYTLHDVFVPAAHTHDMVNPQPIQAGSVYRLPQVSLFATTVATVPLGIARGLLDTFITSIAARSRTGTSAALRDRELIQSELGRADTLHEAGRALLIAAMRELEDANATGGDRLIRARIRYRAACCHAAETALRIADIISSCAGTSAIWERDGLERRIRDIQAAAKHTAMSPNMYVVAGRVLMGLEPGVARF